MAFLHGDDPHVDPVLTHRFGENAVELLAPDGTESLPPMSRVELGLRADLTDGEGKQCSEQSATNDSAIHVATSILGRFLTPRSRHFTRIPTRAPMYVSGNLIVSGHAARTRPFVVVTIQYCIDSAGPIVIV